MMNNIFVGNLSFRATSEDLTKLFAPFGTVANAKIVEKKKGKSLGYGFVDMPNEDEKKAAIAGLDGREFMVRILSVSVLIPRAPRAPRPKKIKSKDIQVKSPKPIRKDDQSVKAPYKKFDSKSKPWVKRERPTTVRKSRFKND